MNTDNFAPWNTLCPNPLCFSTHLILLNTLYSSAHFTPQHTLLLRTLCFQEHFTPWNNLLFLVFQGAMSMLSQFFETDVTLQWIKFPLATLISKKCEEFVWCDWKHLNRGQSTFRKIQTHLHQIKNVEKQEIAKCVKTGHKHVVKIFWSWSLNKSSSESWTWEVFIKNISIHGFFWVG